VPAEIMLPLVTGLPADVTVATASPCCRLSSGSTSRDVCNSLCRRQFQQPTRCSTVLLADTIERYTAEQTDSCVLAAAWCGT